MEGYIERFLAKNKYPNVKNGLITLAEEFENMTGADASLGDDNMNANITLAIQYLTSNTKTNTNTKTSQHEDNINKAEHWIRMINPPTMVSLNLHVIILLKKDNLHYADWRKYLIELSEKVNLLQSSDLSSTLKHINLLHYKQTDENDNTDTDTETAITGSIGFHVQMVYRFLQLLAGLAKEHEDYELESDLIKISHWISNDTDHLTVDKMINKWYASGFIKELSLIKLVIGTSEKIDYQISRLIEQETDDGHETIGHNQTKPDLRVMSSEDSQNHSESDENTENN